MDCRKCGKKNHFAAVCRSNPDVALVEAEAPDVNALYIAGISRAHKGNSRDTGWSSSLRVGGTVVTFKLDTGAEANVLPLAVAEGLPMPLNMQRTDTVLVAYGGARIQPKGIVKLLVQARRKQAQLYFFVTDASDTPLLGRQACVQLDLVRRWRRWPARLQRQSSNCSNNIHLCLKGLVSFRASTTFTLTLRCLQSYMGAGEFPTQYMTG
ncbi:hypothetical protein AAFF_G00350080 [Aldrovandia affinis]|uniref:Peptidase A2 domain-containing protein n=1 Tax=Aldrovandia affinis TaxID=143900 RepID=A0AAD7SJB2_9TELE|nr:hypothetical protein AAFF_G00350080 [Aldrovandia affinis]